MDNIIEQQAIELFFRSRKRVEMLLHEHVEAPAGILECNNKDVLLKTYDIVKEQWANIENQWYKDRINPDIMDEERDKLHIMKTVLEVVLKSRFNIDAEGVEVEDGEIQ